MANLRDYRELQADIASRPIGERAITREDYAEFLQRTATIAGAQAIKNGSSPDQDMTLVAGWNPVVWNVSRDTQGVKDGLNEVDASGNPTPQPWYEIKNAGAGDWVAHVKLRATVAIAGTYEMRVTTVDASGNSSQTPYEDEVTTVEADSQILLVIAFALFKNVEGGEKIQVELRGPNGSVVRKDSGQFGAIS